MSCRVATLKHLAQPGKLGPRSIQDTPPPVSTTQSHTHHPVRAKDQSAIIIRRPVQLWLLQGGIAVTGGGMLMLFTSHNRLSGYFVRCAATRKTERERVSFSAHHGRRSFQE